ncbi:MAG: HupE/UreJ family protein, partial [Candidatus Eremiobacteraeota bacterium]|nr:HupE/UreJ family protein [Candidatus Eremiobacteraeota bacterium]
QQGPAQLTIPIEFSVPPQAQIDFEYHLYLPKVANQQCLAVFTSNLGSSSTLLLTEESPFQSLNLTPAPVPAAVRDGEQRPDTLAGFFQLGVKHILTGWDHLLFLFTLVIVGGSIWRWVQVITAFSVSHSISLALAVFGVVHLSPDIIEPIIAISITVSAIFSFRGVPGQRLHGGWILAFVFGLIHGLGFAGVLAELQLSGRQALVPLVGFNLGVEAGQLAVAAVLLPVIRLLSRNDQGTKARQLLTALAGLMGLYWFAFGTPA